MRKPFDVLAEGLLSENSRGDWTPLELFCREVAAWPAEIAEFLAAAKMTNRSRKNIVIDDSMTF
jgi:hypothetical protein